MWTETVVLLTATSSGTDSSGEPIPGPDAEEPVNDCIVWPSGPKEDLEVGVLRSMDEWVVAFPTGTVVPAGQRARIRDKVFYAVADGFSWVNPFTGWMPGVTVTFKRVAPKPVTTDG